MTGELVNTEGINGHILGRRTGGNTQRQSARQNQVGGRVHCGDQQNEQQHQQLSCKNPAATLSQAANQRQLYPVNQWSPEEVDGIDRCYRPQKTNIGSTGAGVGQPAAEAAADKNKGKTAGTAHQKYPQQTDITIAGEGLSPGLRHRCASPADSERLEYSGKRQRRQ